MMKNRFAIEAYSVVSEPGDSTRYEYICVNINDADDRFIFIDEINIEKTPVVIYRDEVGMYKNLDDCVDNRHDLNPYRLMEYVRTIREILSE